MKPFKRSFGKRDTGSSFHKDGGQRFGNRPPRDSDRPKFELHRAVCEKCGRDCDVPFKPTGNKPIYCRSCFRANEEGGTERNEELAQINKKLDKIMKAFKIN